MAIDSGKAALDFIGSRTGRASWRFGAISLSLIAASAWGGGEPPGARPSRCDYVNIKTLPIEFSGIRPLVAGSIDGNAVKMLVDTGSDRTVLLRSAVEKFALPLAGHAGTSIGTNGVSEAYGVRLGEFKIGEDDADSSDLAVIWHATGNLPYDALVGASFLFEHDLELDLARQVLRFFRPAARLLSPFACGRAFLAYWDENAFVAGLDAMSAEDLRPVVTAEVNGERIRAMIDTGATVSIISPAAAARAGVTPRSQGVEEVGYFDGIGSRMRKSWLAPFGTFSLGGEIVENVRLHVKDISWDGADAPSDSGSALRTRGLPEMILGIDFLKAHRLLFAMSQKRLYFSYLGGPVMNGQPQWTARAGAEQAAGQAASPGAACASGQAQAAIC